MLPVVWEDTIRVLGLSEESVYYLHENSIYTVGHLLDGYADNLPLAPDHPEIMKALQILRGNGVLVMPTLEDAIAWWRTKGRSFSITRLVPEAGRQEATWTYVERTFPDLRCLLSVTEEEIFTFRLKSSAAVSIRRKLAALKEASPTEEELQVVEAPGYRDPFGRPQVYQVLEAIGEAVGEDRSSLCALLGCSASQLSELLDMMEQDGQIMVDEDQVMSWFWSLGDWVQSLQPGQGRTVLEALLAGETLAEAGRKLGLNASGARSRMLAALRDRPILQEDRYRCVISRYRMTLEEFRQCFHEPPEVYRYLQMTEAAKRPTQPLEEILDDRSVPGVYRRKIRRALFSPAPAGEGKGTQAPPVPEIREDRQPGPWTGLDRTFLDALSLDRYRGQDVSSRKLWLDAQDTMERCGIRDEYDLFDALRSLIPERNPWYLKFGTAPQLQFGKVNPGRQVRDLVRAYEPLTMRQLAGLFEREYGYTPGQFLAGYARYARRFLFGTRLMSVVTIRSMIEQDGHAGLSGQEAPEEAPLDPRPGLSRALSEDCYLEEDMASIGRRAVPEMRISTLMQDLGFAIVGPCFLRITWRSLEEYFRHFILEREELSLSLDAMGFADLPAFASALEDLRRERLVLEYEPGVYMTFRRMQRENLFRNVLEDYCHSVAVEFGEGEYFTLTSLRQDGFHHALERAPYGSCFFASVLQGDRDHFASCKMGDSILFRRGSSPFQPEDFIRTLSGARPDPDTAVARARDTYGIYLTPEQVAGAYMSRR